MENDILNRINDLGIVTFEIGEIDPNSNTFKVNYLETVLEEVETDDLIKEKSSLDFSLESVLEPAKTNLISMRLEQKAILETEVVLDNLVTDQNEAFKIIVDRIFDLISKEALKNEVKKIPKDTDGRSLYRHIISTQNEIQTATRYASNFYSIIPFNLYGEILKDTNKNLLTKGLISQRGSFIFNFLENSNQKNIIVGAKQEKQNPSIFFIVDKKRFIEYKDNQTIFRFGLDVVGNIKGLYRLIELT